MSVTITLDSTNGETPDTVEAKVRNLAANQGLNNFDMWQKIDAEITAVAAAQPTKYRNTATYIQPTSTSNGVAHTGNKHGNK